VPRERVRKNPELLTPEFQPASRAGLKKRALAINHGGKIHK
jgi:hypothetical protein